MAKKKAEETELLTVRVPKSITGPLRLACQATGRSMSEEIRLGIEMRLDQLNTDDVRAKVAERIKELQDLYDGLDSSVPPEGPGVGEGPSVGATESATTSDAAATGTGSQTA